MYKLESGTARRHYLSSVETAEIIQDSIDLAEQYIERSLSFRMPEVIVQDDEGNEVRRIAAIEPDQETIDLVRERIARDKERVRLVREDIREVLEDHPELKALGLH